DLLNTISRVMSGGWRVEGKEESDTGSSPATRHPAPATLHVLVAEDNELNFQLLELLLVRRGHRVRVAINGREALALLGIRGQKAEVRRQRSEVRSQKSATSRPCPL